MAKETIDKLAKSLADSLPDGLRSVRDDLEKNFRSVLRAGLDRLDLVTREEFEVQQAVLARTRANLATLEERLGALEARPAAVKKSASKKPARKRTKKKAKKKATRKKR